MRNDSRSRDLRIRQRNNARNNKKRKTKKIAIYSMVLLLIIGAVVITSITIVNYMNENKLAMASNEDDAVILEEIQDKLDKASNKDIVKINLLGDIMMGRDTEQAIEGDYILPFTEVAPMVSKADITFANIEGPIYETDNKGAGKINNKKTILNTFNVLGLDVVNIANDHTMDYGTDGLNSTKKVIEDYEMPYTGLGKDMAIIEKNNTKIGFLGLTDVFIGNKQPYLDAGVNSLEDLSNEDIEKLIKGSKVQVDVLIVYVNWGVENSSYVSNAMIEKARLMIDSGADAICGSHAGRLMIFETYKDKPIIYGMGYFMHDTNDDISKESAIFELRVEDKKITQLKLTPVIIENKNKVRLATGDMKNKILGYMSKNSERYGSISEVISNSYVVVKYN